MHSTSRPSPRVTLPQKFLKSAAQAPSTVSTAAASRSLRSGGDDALGLAWANAVECASPAAATQAAEAIRILKLFPILGSPLLVHESFNSGIADAVGVSRQTRSQTEKSPALRSALIRTTAKARQRVHFSRVVAPRYRRPTPASEATPCFGNSTAHASASSWRPHDQKRSLTRYNRMWAKDSNQR